MLALGATAEATKVVLAVGVGVVFLAALPLVGVAMLLIDCGGPDE